MIKEMMRLQTQQSGTMESSSCEFISIYASLLYEVNSNDQRDDAVATQQGGTMESSDCKFISIYASLFYMILVMTKRCLVRFCSR